ncbi:O-antigen ligase family protein [Blastococcus sp. SYSU D00813]
MGLRKPSIAQVPRAIPFAIIAATPVLAMATVASPSAALLLIGVAGLVLVVRSARARLVALTVGGMVVLQSESGVGKFAYIGALAVALAMAVAGARRWDARLSHALKPAVVGGAILGAYLLFEALTSTSNAVGLDAWVRDSLPYLMLAAAPLLAVDFAHRLPWRFVQRLIVCAGLYATVAFAVVWLNVRGLSVLPVESIGISGTPMCAFAFCFALASWGAAERRRPAWAVLAVVIPVLLLVTGTRNSLLFLAAFLGLAGSRLKGRIPLVKLVSMGVVAIAAAAALLPVLAGRLTTDKDFLFRRLASIGDLLSGSTDDLSYNDRTRQYDLALDTWQSSPLFGTGPGYLYDAYQYKVGADRFAFTMDTPLIIPAKLGLVGVLILVALVVALILSARRITQIGALGVTGSTGRAFFVVQVVMLPLGAAVENKTFAMVILLLLLAQAVHAVRDSKRNDERPGRSDAAPSSAGKFEVVPPHPRAMPSRGVQRATLGRERSRGSSRSRTGLATRPRRIRRSLR